MDFILNASMKIQPESTTYFSVRKAFGYEKHTFQYCYLSYYRRCISMISVSLEVCWIGYQRIVSTAAVWHGFTLSKDCSMSSLILHFCDPQLECSVESIKKNIYLYVCIYMYINKYILYTYKNTHIHTYIYLYVKFVYIQAEMRKHSDEALFQYRCLQTGKLAKVSLI